MKVVYVFSTLAKTGGTERIITEKANYLAEQFGYDVIIINCYQKNDDINHFIISKKYLTFPNINTNILKDFGLNGI